MTCYTDEIRKQLKAVPCHAPFKDVEIFDVLLRDDIEKVNWPRKDHVLLHPGHGGSLTDDKKVPKQLVDDLKTLDIKETNMRPLLTYLEQSSEAAIKIFTYLAKIGYIFKTYEKVGLFIGDVKMKYVHDHGTLAEIINRNKIKLNDDVDPDMWYGVITGIYIASDVSYHINSEKMIQGNVTIQSPEVEGETNMKVKQNEDGFLTLEDSGEWVIGIHYRKFEFKNTNLILSDQEDDHSLLTSQLGLGRLVPKGQDYGCIQVSQLGLGSLRDKGAYKSDGRRLQEELKGKLFLRSDSV